MSCRVSKSKLSGIIRCPANKSYTHRAVFIATLARGTSRIEHVLRSADTDATIDACKKFGARITDEGDALTVQTGDPVPVPSEIDAKNSGTTIRIAAAVAGLGGGKSVLTGDSSLQKRPMKPLLEALESMGARCGSSGGCPPVTVEGIIAGGDVRISGGVSSQFITAIMIAAPLAEKGVTLEIEGELISKPYVDATIATMKKFGVEVGTVLPYKKYHVPRRPYSPATFAVPSDFSSLALLLSAAALVGDGVSVDVATGDLPQGDGEFINILKGMGAGVEIRDGRIAVRPVRELAGGRFDLGNAPDLLPPLSILAIRSKNPIEIFNVRHARFKETDRIRILCRELEKTGLRITEKEDGMVIENRGGLTGADFDSEGDHRLFMAFCIAGMCVGASSVSHPESVAVSYPDYISEINRIGGKIEPRA